MELTHENAGLLIAVIGGLVILLAGPLPAQVRRWHIQTLEVIEPAMLVWVMRLLGLAFCMLGLVTAANVS